MCDLDRLIKLTKRNSAHRGRLHKRLLMRYKSLVTDTSTQKKKQLVIPEKVIQDYVKFCLYLPEQQDTGYVYSFLASRTIEDDVIYHNLKIGYTKNFEKRRKNYCGPSAVVKVLLLQLVDDARAAEKRLLKAFDHFPRTSREWFLVKDSQLEDVKQLLHQKSQPCVSTVEKTDD